MRNLQVTAASSLMLCAMVLGGCVVGQSLPASYEAGPAAAAATGTAVAVAVRDERPFVKSGDKPHTSSASIAAASAIPGT